MGKFKLYSCHIDYNDKELKWNMGKQKHPGLISSLLKLTFGNIEVSLQKDVIGKT